MQIIKISPRGYCYGVVDAMVIARNAALDKSLPRPIYILGMIVHNKHVTDAFEEEGIITLDGENRMEILEKVNTGTVIFTAHGISPEVRKLARDKGLVTLDATCPDVTRTHDLIEEKTKQGFQVIYIGKKGHPEPEGAVGVAPGLVHLVETPADVEALTLDSERLIVTNQTTMSQWDVADTMKKFRRNTRMQMLITKYAMLHRYARRQLPGKRQRQMLPLLSEIQKVITPIASHKYLKRSQEQKHIALLIFRS